MALRLYRALVGLMPADFRREYGDEMCRVVAEHRTDLGVRPGAYRAIRFWTRETVALLWAAARLRRQRDQSTGGITMEDFLQDLRHGARSLLGRPGFTVVTVLTLGLGIGATTAIFSAVHTVLLRPLPYADAERVVVIFQTDASTGERGEGVSAGNLRDFATTATLFDAVSVAEPWSLDFQVDGRAESLRTWSVTPGFFEAIGAEAQLGRTFIPDDYAAAEQPVVLIGHRSWYNRFGADPNILGTTLNLDGLSRTVVGVLPANFRFPDEADLWIPRLPQPWDDSSRAAGFMTGIARLAGGTSVAQAQAESDRIAASLRSSFPDANAEIGFRLVPLRELLLGEVQTPLLLLMLAVGFVLLIACANVAGLMLARGAQRRREFALRGALGAGTGRLISHVTVECLLLTAAGCTVGVLLTYGGIYVIQALGPDHLPRIDEMRVNAAVLGFAMLMAALSAAISGLAPSIHLSRPDLREVLGDGSRNSTAGRGQSRARSNLVVAQVAAAVVLLVGAGLLLRSFGALLDQEIGFDPENRLAVQIFAYDYGPGEQAVFIQQALAGISAVPGVKRVALASDAPGAADGVLARMDITVPFTIADRAPLAAGREPIATVTQVSHGYFEVMGIDVPEGRDFDATDVPGSNPVVMINQSLARRNFGEDDPVGQSITVQLGPTPVVREIIGVVRDTRPLGPGTEPRPEVYLPLSQIGTGSLTIIVQADQDAGALTTPAMEAIWAVNPAQSIWGAATLDSQLAEGLKDRRFILLLLSSFAGLALALAAIGIYGLISFSVERRMAELGIRRALGGRAGTLMAMVLGEGARLAATGLAIGLALAWYLSRFIRGMLFDVEPTDPLTFVLLTLLVFTIAAVATLLPALRAIRVDPVNALRSE